MCKKLCHKLWLILGITAAAGLLLVIFVNGVIIAQGNKRILHAAEAASLRADCILILGAGVREDGSPSHMLEDRLKTGVDLHTRIGECRCIRIPEVDASHILDVRVARSNPRTFGSKRLSHHTIQ